VQETRRKKGEGNSELESAQAVSARKRGRDRENRARARETGEGGRKLASREGEGPAGKGTAADIKAAVRKDMRGSGRY